MNEPSSETIVSPRSPQFVAFSMMRVIPSTPRLYQRTFGLGVVIGPLVAGIVSLFTDRAVNVWCWSDDEGFAFVKLGDKA